MLRNNIEGFLYRNLIRPVMFLFAPEEIHDKMLYVGSLLGSNSLTRFCTRIFFGYKNDLLKQRMAGLAFESPIGLAAGFDKDGQITLILPELSFGFGEFGSITRYSHEGNPRPWMYRLKKEQSLVIHFGLKNAGAEVVLRRLVAAKKRINNFPIGVSVAAASPAMNKTEAEIIADITETFTIASKVADYITLNISCPNLYRNPNFQELTNLEKLLKVLPLGDIKQPVFLKLSPDITNAELETIVELARRYKITGFVVSNLTKERGNRKDVPIPGGLSGKLVKDLANKLIGKLYRLTRGKMIIIGCGGVFTAEDAYEKIRLGANLIQLVTGMIYLGPQQISEINYGLVKLLRKDGYKTIPEAIGVDSKV